MEADSQQVNEDLINIAPLDRTMVRGAFLEPDDEFSHLPSWFRSLSIQSQRQRKSKTYVALVDDEVVGYITLSMGLIDDIPGVENTTGHELQVCILGKLYVTPSRQSHGIGQLLLGYGIGVARSVEELIGCVGIWVSANQNPRTISFYERNGFEAIGESNAEDRTVNMFLKLNSPAVHP